MQILSLLRLAPDDSSENPERWSTLKLASEMERLRVWLDSATLSDHERAVVERVLLRICKVAAKKKRRTIRRPHFGYSSTVPL